ncbi:hypothetical protein PHET_02391 [Paragonimus heterotremus]|uniref:Sorting nexin-14 n=1 Tax=Paragonimus heterotremus TaxID=100268 RepID=A0A8J4WJS2_9TREM|nr:hypothetical protein PHET_02391 [Paragonimus heterotremus]
MFLALSLGFLFFLIGLSIKSLIGNSVYLSPYRLKTSSLTHTSRKLPKAKNSHFDSVGTTVGQNTNDALEAIFDIIIERYILVWYRTLSDNLDFVVQVRLYLQYVASVLVHRVKSVCLDSFKLTDQKLDLTDLLDRVVNLVFGHTEHVYSALSSNQCVDSILEDTILRGFGSHLHTCMISRSSELAYLRALVNRLLPHVSLQPGLLLPNNCQAEHCYMPNVFQFRHDFLPHRRKVSHQIQCVGNGLQEEKIPRRSSIGSLLGASHSHMKLGANRAAYSFLVEILSACVLLPAMDAVANPDVINKLILWCCAPSAIVVRRSKLPTQLIIISCPHGNCSDPKSSQTAVLVNKRSTLSVPVLNTYVHTWRQWLAEKSKSTPVRLEQLLQQPEEFYPFMQYMKSVQATVPLTALFLMHDIDRRVRSDPLPPDTCHEIRAQVRHVLALGRGKSVLVSELDEVIDYSATTQLDDVRLDTRLVGFPVEFEALLAEFLSKPLEPNSLRWLIRTPIWKDAYHTAYEAVEQRFLPLYVESPEYLSHIFGLTQLGSPVVSSATRGTHLSELNRIARAPHRTVKRPMSSSDGIDSSLRKHSIATLPSDLLRVMVAISPASSPTNKPHFSSGLFTNPLKTMFAGHTVEGHVLRAADQDGPRPPLPITIGRPANRGSSVFDWVADLATRDQSAPSTYESVHQLHAELNVPQIDMSDWRVFIPGLSRPEVQPERRLIDQLAPPSGTPLLSLPSSYMARPHDAPFKARITEELNNLQSNTIRTPQLSAQFMFTVRTECIVDGIRQPIARVNRKYSEFYVLEQKLMEFHGDAITQQLPRKQITPRTFEFMESKRELFEEYLQASPLNHFWVNIAAFTIDRQAHYLLAQPFLRSSELLHRFLTSDTPFNTNLLFELNLGRLVKSVPLKLVKEKGQYLHKFLTAFYVSCSPRPIILEPDEPPRFTEPVVTILPSSGVGTLGGLDVIASPDHYTVGRGSKQHTSAKNRLSTLPVSGSSQGRWTGTLSSSTRSIKPTWLDNRLRMKVFWNNAGFPITRRQELYNTPCELRNVHLCGLSHLILFVCDKFTGTEFDYDSTMLTSEGVEAAREPQQIAKSPAVEQALSSHNSAELIKPAADSWDVTSVTWSEAMLNGPMGACAKLNFVPSSPLTSTLPTNQSTAPEDLDSPDRSVEKLQPDASDCTVSITMADVTAAFSKLYTLVGQHLIVQLRSLLRWSLYILWWYFDVAIDRWLAKRIIGFVRSSLTDKNLASIFEQLKVAIFYSDIPSTELEKAERKAQAHAALQQLILNHKLACLSNPERIKIQIDRLFLCFQYPKWNKQLSYVLLDQLVAELFPELVQQAVGDQPTNGRIQRAR